MQNDDKSTFIGIGKNPDPNVPDLPLGLGMALAQNDKAIDAFGALSAQEKTELINNIQGASTGEDAKQRIADAVNRLSGNAGNG